MSNNRSILALQPNEPTDERTPIIEPIVALSIAPDCFALPTSTTATPLRERLTHAHKPLLSYLAGIIKPAFKAIFLSASNTYPSGNPSTCCAHLLHASHEATCNILKSEDTSTSNVELDQWSFVDLLENKESGDTFIAAMKSTSIPNPLSPLIPHLLDHVPLLLLFAEMHRFAMQYPMIGNKQFYYFSTNVEVLNALYELLKDRLDFIPEGLTLHYYYYSLAASAIIPPRVSLQGRGEADELYDGTVKGWARDLREALPNLTQPWSADILCGIPSITAQEYAQYFSRLERQDIDDGSDEKKDALSQQHESQKAAPYQDDKQLLNNWRQSITSMKWDLQKFRAEDFEKSKTLIHETKDLLQGLQDLCTVQVNITRYIFAIQNEVGEIDLQTNSQPHDKPTPLTIYLEQLGPIDVIESTQAAEALQHLIEQLQNKQKDISTISKTSLDQTIWHCDLALTYIATLQKRATYASKSKQDVFQFQQDYRDMAEMARRIGRTLDSLSSCTTAIAETENLKVEAEKHLTIEVAEKKIERLKQLTKAIAWIREYASTVNQPAQPAIPVGPTLHGSHRRGPTPPPLKFSQTANEQPDSGFASVDTSPRP
jgi:hypothetical protein